LEARFFSLILFTLEKAVSVAEKKADKQMRNRIAMINMTSIVSIKKESLQIFLLLLYHILSQLTTINNCLTK